MMAPHGPAAAEPAGDPQRVVATYVYRTADEWPASAAAVADRIAVLGSTGVVLDDTPTGRRIRDRHAATVLGVDLDAADGPSLGEARETTWRFRIAYPVDNIGAQIPLLLATVYGESASIDGLRLEDLELPPSFVASFAGPRFGIQGIRRSTGVDGRPLVITMIKPSLGLTPIESAAVVREAGLGGVDGVKDDELLVEHPWSRLRDRVREHERAAAVVYEETGRRIICFVNVTDRPDRLVRNAHDAIGAGASGIMVDYVAVGVAALGMLVDDPAINVPILGHLAFSGAIYGGPRAGIGRHLILGLLPRLTGADVVVYPGPHGTLSFDHESHLAVATALRQPLGRIQASLPTPGGGVHAGMVASLIADLGTDFAIGAGSAIHRHPMGAKAGAQAIRQAITAALAGEPVAQAAKRHRELAMALGMTIST